jgi:hypothetical protein
MNEETFLMYKNLENFFNLSLQVCDPIEFQVRQRNLLLNLSAIILKPYLEEVAKRVSESSPSNSSDS